MKKRIVVICPGRGSYTKDTLGYLKPHRAQIQNFIDDLDQRRRALNEPTITELDSAATFQPGTHTKGEHASTLIYACSYADFQSIDTNKYEIVAVTGNSMGWYLALAYGGALNWASAFEVVNTMGSMMKEKIIGGQIIYPVVDGDWLPNLELQEAIKKCMQEARSQGGEVHESIYLGGYAVIGGDTAGLNYLLKNLPKIENYPFQLVNHAAFHTPMLQSTSERAFATLGPQLFTAPQIPLIDGRGKIWQPYATEVNELYEYTLGYQVYAPYDFTKAITVALKEFAPDQIFLLGPGNSLGGSIGQILIANQWKGIRKKSDFTERQKADPILISLGL